MTWALVITGLAIFVGGVNLGLWIARRRFAGATAEMEVLTAQLQLASEHICASEPLGWAISENHVAIWAYSEEMRA